MTFNSLSFVVFFCAVFASQWALRSRRARHVVLLVASYVFYGWWDARFCLLMLGVTASAYWTAIGFEKCANKRLLTVVGVAVPLAVLGIFKYANFFVDSFCALFGIATPGSLNIILPVGISFYTFQSLSYVIDVRRGELEASHDFVHFALYVSFFPQLVAGPIVRAADFLPQLNQDRRPTRAGVTSGLSIFVWGLFKKTVLADRLSVFVDAVFLTPLAYDSLTVALAVLSYALQIWFDFAGYSDMAIGCAKMLGYDLNRNFDLPYVSRNVTEFWRRWHISLSTWLKSYLYIPLGGNRRGSVRTYVNLMLTMALGGLWHGAGLNFVLWGVLHGAALCVHKLWQRRFPANRGSAPANVFCTLATFLFVCLCWIPFRAASFGATLQILGRLFAWSAGVRQIYVWSLVAAGAALAATAYCRLRQGGRSDLPVFDPTTFRGAFGLTMLAGLTLILMYTGSNPFIYFQF